MAKLESPASVGWSTSERLPGARLTLAGAPGADALTWAARAACAALLLAALWWVWALVRPLPGSEGADAALPPRVPSIPESLPADPQRIALLEALSRDNFYAFDRRAWTRLPMATAAGANSPDGQSADAPAQPGAPGQIATSVIDRAGAPIAFTPTENLPDDVKKALSALELKAVRAERDGGGVAMISFVHSPTRQLSAAYRPGDEFKDEANPSAPWRVVAVDISHRRVLLSRSGVTASLPLYKGLGEGPTTTAASETSATVAGLRVEGRTRDEVIMDLRNKGLAEADILAVIEELDRQLELSGESPVVSLERIVDAPADAAGEAGARRTPPAGMEAILQMMTAQSQQAAEKPADGEKRPGKRPSNPRRKP